MSDLPFSQAAFLKAALEREGFTQFGAFETGAHAYLSAFYDDARQNEYLDLDLSAVLDLAETLWTAGSTRAPGEPMVDIRPVKTGETARHMVCVVMDDQAFLVDSIIAAISAFGVDVHGLYHPIVRGYRDGTHRWASKGTEVSESIIGVVVPRLGRSRADKLMAELCAVLQDVALANADFEPMLADVGRARDALRARHGNTPEDVLDEATAFLDWMLEGNFVLLGARTYAYETASGDINYADPDVAPGSQLGVLRDADTTVLRQSNEPSVITTNVQAFLKSTPPVTVAKSNLNSRVHRRVRMDYVTVKIFSDSNDDGGRVIGETRFVGLLTSEAYSLSPWDVPLIRSKLARVMAEADLSEGSHNAGRLKYVLSTYPRDELFQIGHADLFRIATSVAQAYDRPRTRVFARRDAFDRFVSVLVYTPREQYSTRARQRIGDYLARAFDGRVSAFYPQYSNAPMARVHFIIGLDPDRGDRPPISEVEAHVASIVQPWFEGVIRGAEDADGVGAFRHAFPTSYQDRFDPLEGRVDVETIRAMKRDVGIRVYDVDPNADADTTTIRAKLYCRGHRIEPSDIVPVMENFALHTIQETGYEIAAATGDVWIHDFEFELETANTTDDLGDVFEAAFLATWCGDNEDDNFNKLILAQAADWRDIAFLRLVASYRRQTGLDPVRSIQVEALQTYPELTAKLIALFHARFDPEAHGARAEREAASETLLADIVRRLGAVTSLEHDQAIRRMADVVAAGLRTNFYQRAQGGGHKSYISLKIDSGAVSALPQPVPFREIFVSSPRVDGVHLRFGPIARGGIRWSDRRNDFRAEVLGLVKAQQVKNAVIVPVGSKGGFYPKQLPTDRAEAREEAIAAYTVFISGLLDITDNYVGEDVVHPDNTVCWDGDDPYLVVAADKGTATFSDIANGIARDYDYWLDDAFASGGSVGYDHKEMGITARGAWEAVKRHFRELGKDIQSEAFTVLGVGDMAGDVFGNGMLLSEHIRLRAAFNHLHIFIDPDPDAAKTYAERKRLFEAVKGWDAYNQSLISKGGGVFERSAKSIDLTPEMKEMTGLAQDAVTPDELIHALLTMEVELIYFGGIGTYIKASDETHGEVFDKANDRLRVDADEVRAKVVGEGANLGITQAARIEMARRGVKLNTDAIDNSAGVDSSDNEVNIKILLRGAIETGSLDAAKRDSLLASMTEEVADLVLAHNYDQTAALSLARYRAVEDHAAYGRFMQAMEKDGALDRRVEGLPSTEEMAARADEGLTRPELAVLLAYAKIELYKDVVELPIFDDPYYHGVLERYFPKALGRFDAAMRGHRLREEIIASRLTNLIVDTVGPLFLQRLRAQTRGKLSAIVESFVVAYEALGVRELEAAISKLDNKVEAIAQIRLRNEIAEVLERVVAWLVRRGETGDLGERIARRRDILGLVDETWLDMLSPYDAKRARARIKRYVTSGVPGDLAADVALLRSRASGFDVIALSESTDLDTMAAAKLFYAVGAALKTDRVRAALLKTEPSTHWEALALRHQQEELFAAQADFAARIAKADGKSDLDAVMAWLRANVDGLRAYRVGVTEMAKGGWSVAKFSIVTTLLQSLRAQPGKMPKSKAENV